ncbi:MAG: LysR family transcriptional regulator substrate-binding protein, partial [Parvularculaceae bacterium]|nr:LysR family transcriptional regulator substrate-binding protein [Parvularculaceae bacterium]
REQRNTHLSELGRMMAPYFQTIYEQSITAKTTASEFARLGKATLKIGAMCTIGPAIVADFLARYSRDHENVDISVSALGLGDVKEKLKSGEFEVALLASPDPLDEEFHALPLFSENFVCVVSPRHRLAALDVVPCRALDGERYINRAKCEYYDLVHETFIANGIRTRRIFSSECDEWVLGMIKAGLGYGYFPEFAVADPDVVKRPLTDPAFSRTVSLVTVRGRPYSPAVGAFVKQARMEKWPVADAARRALN